MKYRGLSEAPLATLFEDNYNKYKYFQKADCHIVCADNQSCRIARLKLNNENIKHSRPYSRIKPDSGRRALIEPLY